MLRSIRPTRAAQARAGEIEGNRLSSATRLSSSTKMPARSAGAERSARIVPEAPLHRPFS
jgi:hypothetical protein